MAWRVFADQIGQPTPYVREDGSRAVIGDATALGPLSRVYEETPPSESCPGGYYWAVVDGGVVQTIQYGGYNENHYRSFVRPAIIAPGPAGTVVDWTARDVA